MKDEIYIGSRYVPKVVGDWKPLTDYEELSIVLHEGNSYTSKKKVPAGIELSNENYWAMTGNLNANLSNLTAQLAQTQKDFDTAVGAVTVDSEVVLARGDKTTLGSRLNKIESEKANKKQEEWITPILLNNWTNFGGNFGVAGYRKSSLGKTELKGTVKGGSLTVPVYTLPPGYRPLTDRYYPVVANSSFGMVTVKSTGDVRVDIGSNAWVSLNNINFYTDE